MTDKRVTEFTVANPLTGNEAFLVVQGGASKQSNSDAIKLHSALQIYGNAVYLNKAYSMDFSSLFFIQYTGNSFEIDMALDIDNTLSANSDEVIPSQKAIKYYVDNKPIDGGSF
jgi:hypothetical protein